MDTISKDKVIKAILWSEWVTMEQAEQLYSVTSERYHKRIVELYDQALVQQFKKKGWYHPVYNPMNEDEVRWNKARLKIIFVELLLSN